MKKITLLSAVALATMASPAFAQSETSSESFTINAEVPQVCAMADIDDIDLGEMDINAASGPDSLSLLGPVNERGNAFWISCNDTSTLTLSSANQGLKNISRGGPTGDDAALFTDTIHYRFRLEGYFDGISAVDQPRLNTVAGATDVTNGTEIHREVTPFVNVVPADNPLRFLAGQYEDVATVEITTL